MILDNSKNRSLILGSQYKPENLDVKKVCFAK